jgi:hypothetical protein
VVPDRELSERNSLVDNFLALLPCGILTIHIELCGVSMVLAVGLDILDHLSQAKQIVHAFKRQTLCLGNEEPDEDEHGEAEASVDEEGTGRC